ncbi:MAG: hypothetical protein Fur0018_21040 [Anaerolineales bacterium]
MHWLSSPTALHLPPKIAALARLFQANLPVPDGFVLSPHEAACIAAPRLEDTDTCQALREALYAAYHELQTRTGSALVVVRAANAPEYTGEPHHAAHEVHFNINNADSLLSAVCSTALTHQIAGHGEVVSMPQKNTPAILVQHMITAEAGGEIFTTHPITSDNRYLLIEALPNAEAMPSEEALNASARLTFSRDGTAHTLIGAEKLPPSCRSTDFWQPLIALAHRAEDLLGAPQEISWAYANGKFWILDSRPFVSQTVPDPTPDPVQWTRIGLGETLSGVVTPLTWSVLSHIGEQVVPPFPDLPLTETAECFNGRVYMRRQALWDRYASIWGLKASVVLSQGFGDEAVDIRPLRAAQKHLSPGERLDKSLYVWRELLTGRYIRPKLEKALNALGPQLVFLTEENLSGASLNNLRKHLRASQVVTRQVFQVHVQASFFASCACAAIWQRLEKAIGAQGASQWMAAYRIAPRDKALWDTQLTALVSRVHDFPALESLFRSTYGDVLLHALNETPEGQELLKEIRRRARLMGDRAVGEFELYRPRWSEDPAPLVLAIQGRLITASHPTQPIPRQLRNSRIFQPTRYMSPPGRVLFRRAQEALAASVRLRERTRGLLIACFGEIRRCTLAAGKRLYERGYLSQVDDVFLLNLDELDGLLIGEYRPDLPARLAQRQRQMVYYERHPPSASITRSAAATELHGNAVSSGIAIGKARLIHSLRTASLRPGEILVTEATDPGWLPLFIAAGGIVTEIGGLLSHTATLARELGKPAVFAVPEATQRIRDGQKIRVDGWTGTVTLVNE